MIDLHFHILPDLDDGPKTIEESIQIARKVAEQGINTIFATPHHKNGTYENPKQKVLQRIKKFNSRLKKEGIPVNILPGQEIRIFGEIVKAYENGEILTLNETPYLLIELPSTHMPSYTNQVLFDLQLMGLKPIIVHPERNADLLNDPDKLYELVKQGILTQLTAASILGDFGKKIQRFSHDLIEAGMAHLIASDAHNLKTRPCRLRDAYEFLERNFGVEARYYFQENAELIANNQTVFVGQPERIKRKKFLGLF